MPHPIILVTDTNKTIYFIIIYISSFPFRVSTFLSQKLHSQFHLAFYVRFRNLYKIFFLIFQLLLWSSQKISEMFLTNHCNKTLSLLYCAKKNLS